MSPRGVEAWHLLEPDERFPQEVAKSGKKIDFSTERHTATSIDNSIKSMVTLQKLSHQDIHEAAELAASAFLHSPSYCYIFEGLPESRRFSALRWLLSKNFELRLSSGTGICGFMEQPDRSPEMVCFFIMEPQDIETNPWDIILIMNVIAEFPFRFGLQAFRRFLEVKAHHEKLIHDFLHSQFVNGDTTKYFSLKRMVVRPDKQGLGIGNQVLTEAIEMASSQNRGVVLYTRGDRNIKFYDRLGFDVVLREDSNFNSFTSPSSLNTPDPSNAVLMARSPRNPTAFVS
uniref:N-acetyltransferase domain-containing protein n=1 Tax=Octactis speculum TaxID=3111310 RepID=A0A7S2H940_9STRA|mmetsp:Transcript_62511/g.85907  ORF Transcript_62511/g.85907 Transcript_62511/m.85907 type:complete len:287 (+) Transcript_62511:92-952(+)